MGGEKSLLDLLLSFHYEFSVIIAFGFFLSRVKRDGDPAYGNWEDARGSDEEAGV